MYTNIYYFSIIFLLTIFSNEIYCKEKVSNSKNVRQKISNLENKSIQSINFTQLPIKFYILANAKHAKIHEKTFQVSDRQIFNWQIKILIYGQALASIEKLDVHSEIRRAFNK
jgi:hypothetical protein